MINWKYCLIIFILIELIYRLIIFYNYRLFLEPFYITLINCSNEFLRVKYHLGFKPINFITKFYNWYKILCRCQIIEFDFYLSTIIRSIEFILFIMLLINIMC
jgi:hypothetical protein